MVDASLLLPLLTKPELYRKDKLALPIMLEAKRRLGKKLRERGHARRDWQSEGHDLRG